MNNQEDFKAVIAIWETLAELWRDMAAEHKAVGNAKAAASCIARQFTFTRCASDLRAITGINGPVEEPPSTIPGMHYEEHVAVEKALKTPPKPFWKRWFKPTCTGKLGPQ